MTQNIYDNDTFFAGYAAMPRSVEGLAGAAEWPAMRALLPDLKGKRVVDLGCGFGWFCRFAREQGAASVLGLDVSENMLARARETTKDPNVDYQRADLEALSIKDGDFDFAYSSLALHYIVRLDAVFATVHRALKPGARFVFSIEHPIYMAPRHPGWMKTGEGETVWPLNAYLEEGPRETDWLAKGVIKQHRTIGTTIGLLQRAGFALRHLEEWGPTQEQIAAHPEYARERERPMFLLVAAEKS